MVVCTSESEVAARRDRESIPRALGRETAKVDRRYCAAPMFDATSDRQVDSWLSPRERSEFAVWRDSRRRRAWLMGRMLGKQLVAANLADALPSMSIEILSLTGAGRGTRPRIWCDGVEQSWSLSVSHTHRGVLAALCMKEGISIGVDVVAAKTFSDGFVQLWFTPAEQAWFRDAQCSQIACFIWAAKEALYKACNDGESFAPRNIEVLPDGQCSYRQVPLQDHGLQSWSIDGQIAVMATATIGRK
jgi:phosphopantetheinyl transferase